MTILPSYLITSTQLRVTWLFVLAWVYFINFLPQQMSIQQPYADIQGWVVQSPAKLTQDWGEL